MLEDDRCAWCSIVIKSVFSRKQDSKVLDMTTTT